MPAFPAPCALPFFLLFALLPVRAGAESRPVWVVSNGFHTSLALRAVDAPQVAALQPEGAADHLLLGWGQRDFYQGRVNPCTILSSIFWVNPSILHVVPVHGSISRRFPHSDVIRLSLTPEEYQRLMIQLHAAFAHDARGRPIDLGKGYFADSRFYAGRETFWLAHMCNAWVAQKLHRSGVPISVAASEFAPGLVAAAARLGQREGIRRRPSDGF